jgi:hypothetical protein
LVAFSGYRNADVISACGASSVHLLRCGTMLAVGV